MIPFLDLSRIHSPLKQELLDEIGLLIDKSEFVLGDSVENFEIEFARFCNTKFCISVNSGTSALHLALLSLGIGPGDEVIVPSMTFVATAAAVSYTGATPKFVDVDPDTWNIDVSKIEAAITSRTKCIIPVHLHGLMADMPSIMEIARNSKLFVIEDAAQAHGAAIEGQRAGSFGHLACFSFYPGKNLGALGEGGAVVTDDEELRERIKLLRNWGSKNKYIHDVLGFNNRLESLQAVALGIKLKHLENWTSLRQKAALQYEELLQSTTFSTCTVPTGYKHVRHIFAIRANKRKEVAEIFSQFGIGWGIHYPVPLHLQPIYRHLNYQPGDLPVCELLGKELLSLPLFPGIQVDEIETVCKVLTGL